jgi:hypothetical protein
VFAHIRDCAARAYQYRIFPSGMNNLPRFRVRAGVCNYAPTLVEICIGADAIRHWAKGVGGSGPLP